MKLKARWLPWVFFGVVLICSPLQADNISPIVIGATVSLEGRYQEPSLMMQEAFKLWVKEINQKKGLLGRKVKLILYDDKSDIDLAQTLYKRLITQDKVDLVFSPYSSPLTLAASEVSEKHAMVMLAIAAAAEKPWQRNFRYLFQLYAPANRQFIGLLDMMAQKNLKNVALLYDETSAFNLDTAQGIKSWANRFKIDLVFQQEYQNGKASLPDLLAKVKTINPQALVLSAYPPDSYEMIRLLKKMDYSPIVLAMPIVPAHPEFYQRVGKMANHVFGPSQWEPSERIPFPGTKRFIKKFTEFTGHLPSFHAASAYSGCQLLEKAIAQTQSLDNQKLRDYIAALDTVTVLGRFKVEPSGKQVGHNSFIIQWQNGKKEIVWPDKMKTATAIFKAPEE